VTGSNFVDGSAVLWNGQARGTVFAGSTTLRAAIPAEDLASAATAAVSVSNPAPGGGASGAGTFVVFNPAPSPSALEPSSSTAGSPGFSLAVTGSGFVDGSVVLWNGQARNTVFAGSNRLNAAIPTEDLSSAAAAAVSVFNPAPGGGASDAGTFVVFNPAPSLSALAPSSATAGSPGFSLTATGANFVGGSTVLWNGRPLNTHFIDATRLSAAIPAEDLASERPPSL